MAIVFKLLPDGGFVAGDTETRQTSYAYATSDYATMARRLPERVADEMICSANRFARVLAENMGTAAYLDEYHDRMWPLLEGVL